MHTNRRKTLHKYTTGRKRRVLEINVPRRYIFAINQIQDLQIQNSCNSLTFGVVNVNKIFLSIRLTAFYQQLRVQIE